MTATPVLRRPSRRTDLSAGQIAELLMGGGMGFATAAERNGYPGPRHVLENGAALSLSEAQAARTKGLFDAMRAEAVPLGRALIAQELALDKLFTSRTATEANIAGATRAIGETTARLRATHLRYHLAMMDVLTPEQVRRYTTIRSAAR